MALSHRGPPPHLPCSPIVLLQLSLLAHALSLLFPVSYPVPISAVPMAAGEIMRFYSDAYTLHASFTICATAAFAISTLPMAPPLMPPTRPGMWRVTSGSEYCHLTNDGECVEDAEVPNSFNHSPGDNFTTTHVSDELCYVQALSDLLVTASFFNTDENYEFIEFGPAVNGSIATARPNRFSGSFGPLEYQMPAGMLMKWSADFSSDKAMQSARAPSSSFVICGSAAPWPLPHGVPSAPPSAPSPSGSVPSPLRPPRRPPSPFPQQATTSEADGTPTPPALHVIVAVAVFVIGLIYFLLYSRFKLVAPGSVQQASATASRATYPQVELEFEVDRGPPVL